MPAYFGVYRARITNTMDPTGAGRVQVTIPAIAGGGSVWAPVAAPFGPASRRPQIGTAAWVAFEAGDANCPVVLGGSG